MLKQIAWNTFKNTGNIDTMMELIEVDKAIREKQINMTREINMTTETENSGDKKILI